MATFGFVLSLLLLWSECSATIQDHTPIQCLTGVKTETVPEVPVNVIYPDETKSNLKSKNLRYLCNIDEDGNAVIMNTDCVVIWSSMDSGVSHRNGTKVVGLGLSLRPYGSLGIYDQSGEVYWTADRKEAAQRPARLVLENDGFLVLYSVSGAFLWTSQPHKLLKGQTLKGGYSITSPNLQYVCEIKSGNLIIKNIDGEEIWSNGTLGDGLVLRVGPDGTLGIYDQSGEDHWTFGNFGKEAAQLELENDGFLVLYSISRAVLWTSQPHKLLREQSMKGRYSLMSSDGVYMLTMQLDGNLVLTIDGEEIWSTGTLGDGLVLRFHPNGTLAIYDQSGDVQWTAGNFCNEAARLVLENDGFLVLYSKDEAVLWKSQPHKLLRGQTLKGGYSLMSPGRVYLLTMQLDGNLVLSSSHKSVTCERISRCTSTWTIGTSGLGSGAYLQLRSDGNLVLYGADEWDVNTAGSNAKALMLQDDGQLVLCCKEDGGQVWSGVEKFIQEGIYELGDVKEKCDSDVVEIKKIGENYEWTNEAGNTWTLYPTAEVNVLRVGEDSPCYASANYSAVIFNEAGMSGSFGSKYIFKGVNIHILCTVDVSTANAINNNFIGGVVVTLSQDGLVLVQLKTDKSGRGQFRSPPGEVVLTAKFDGFRMAPVHITVEECDISRSRSREKMIKLSLSPEFSGDARVVMNWGLLPRDLDLHVLQLKAGQVVCHAFYDNKNCGGFKLDVDNRLGGDNGAETVTFSKLEADSEYMVFVYDYTVKSGSTYLPQSQARVAFYREGYKPTQISVPTQDNDPSRRWWMVACFNSGGRFVGSNRNLLMSSEPTGCSPSPRIGKIPQTWNLEL